MALEWMDGFDYYANAVFAVQAGWDVSNYLLSSPGRFGGQYAIGSTLTKVLTSVQTRIVSFAFYCNAFGFTFVLLEFYDGATIQVQLQFDSTGHLQVKSGSTVLGTATTPMVVATWNHIQIKVKIDGSTGTYEVRLNDSVNLIGSGANTQVTGNATTDKINFQNPNGPIDDVVVFNTSGAVNNDFPGDCRIQTCYPTGNGSTVDYSPPVGANWQNVDDHPHDSDTTYNEDAAPGDTDLYTHDAITVSGAILGVKHTIVTRKTDVGLKEVAGMVRSGSTDDVGTTQTQSSSYAPTSEMYETDPDTPGVAWTQSGFNAMEHGVQTIT